MARREAVNAPERLFLLHGKEHLPYNEARGIPMATLTVTAKGQITLKQELLRHLNVTPGQKVEVDKLPDGRLVVVGSAPTYRFDRQIHRKPGTKRRTPAHHRPNQEDYRRRLGRQAMKIVADTNVLLRAAVRDDPTQTLAAAHVLRTADLVLIPVAALCEVAWVMRSGYKRPRCGRLLTPFERLWNGENVVTNRLAVEAGLDFL